MSFWLIIFYTFMSFWLNTIYAFIAFCIFICMKKPQDINGFEEKSLSLQQNQLS